MEQIIPTVKTLGPACVKFVRTAARLNDATVGQMGQVQSEIDLEKREIEGRIEKLRTLYEKADILRGVNYSAFCTFHAAVTELSISIPWSRESDGNIIRLVELANEFLNAVEEKKPK